VASDVRPSGETLEVRPLGQTLRSDLEAQPVDLEAQPVAETDIDLSEELAELTPDDNEDELFDGERVGIYTIAADAETPVEEAFDLLPAILDAPHGVDVPIETSASRDGVRVECPDPPEPPDLPDPPHADIEPWVPMYLTPGRLWPAMEGMPAEVPMPRSEQPDWIELVASLRQDLERRRTDPAPAVPDPIAARPSDGAHADVRRLVKPVRTVPKNTKPVQDEWGFFDPEQCGFSTLLAKLEEITDDETIGR
jgi:hypothetical protein